MINMNIFFPNNIHMKGHYTINFFLPEFDTRNSADV